MATQYTAGLTTGQVLTAATMNQIGAVSETYTPTWSSSGVQPAIGNGTLSARYFRLQKLLFIEMFWQAGTTTTFGTGAYAFSLPSGITARAGLNGFMSRGISRVYDASTGVIYYGHSAFVSGSTTVIYGYYNNGNLGQTNPMAFANLDEIYMLFQYEAV
jgi:hypothetical protein